MDTQHLNNKTWNSFLSYKFIYLFICLLFKYAQLIVVLFAFVGGHFSVITDQFSLNQRALIENNWNKWHGYHECTLISMCVCVCVCLDQQCKPHKRSVCGSNGKTYRNHCELHRDACLTGLKVQVAHDGHCKDKCECAPHPCIVFALIASVYIAWHSFIHGILQKNITDLSISMYV